MGAFADYACVAEALVAKMPARLDFATAAAVPLAGLTALQVCATSCTRRPASGCSSPAAPAASAHSRCSSPNSSAPRSRPRPSPRGEALVRRLGADVVVDYTAQRFEEVLSNYDGVFDLVGGDTLTRRVRGGQAGRHGAVDRRPPRASRPRARTSGAAPDWRRCSGLASLGLRLRARRRSARYRYLFMHPSGARPGRPGAPHRRRRARGRDRPRGPVRRRSARPSPTSSPAAPRARSSCAWSTERSRCSQWRIAIAARTTRSHHLRRASTNAASLPSESRQPASLSAGDTPAAVRRGRRRCRCRRRRRPAWSRSSSLRATPGPSPRTR